MTGIRARRGARPPRRVAVTYRANREDLEPLPRLVADVLALVALARGGRDEPVEAGKTEGAAP